jgi:molybdate transport system substrate-binding protein
VPITRYAEQLVANLGSLPGYPADFAAAYAANIVSREDNVANVVGKLALGEGDAGIVYATDAAARISELRSIPVPPEANVSATYAGAVVAGAAHAAEARAFLDWLRGEEGQASLTGLGFAPAP